MVFIATLKLLSPLLSPLFLPLHCSPAPLSSFCLSFVCPPPPTKRSHPLAFNTSSRPLSVSLSYFTNPLRLAILPSPSPHAFFAFATLVVTLARIKIIFFTSSYVSVCASGPSFLCLWVLLFAVNYIRSETLLHSWRSILTFGKSSKMDEWQKKTKRAVSVFPEAFLKKIFCLGAPHLYIIDTGMSSKLT